MKTQQTKIVETTGFDQPEMQEFELRAMNPETDRFIEPGEQLTAPNKAQHSPLPWHSDGSRIFAQTNPGGRKTFIADISGDPPISQRAGNAALIVRAVNNAEPLADALRAILDWIDSGCDPSRKSIERANLALDQWEGKDV